MKTHKPIRSAKELIGGQYYIRVWINDAGEAGTEVFRIAGKPFADRAFFKGLMRINTRRKGPVGDWNDEYYISDMGAEASHPCVRLYRFTPALLARFEKARRNFKEFVALMDSPGDTDHDRNRREDCKGGILVLLSG